MTKIEKCKQIKLLGETAAQTDVFSTLKNNFEKALGGGGVIIYGAGNAGKVFVESLHNIYGVDCGINHFCDRNAVEGQTLLGYPVYKPNDPQFDQEFRKSVTVVIAISLYGEQYDEVVESLRKLGYTRFVNAMPFWIRFLFFKSEEHTGNIISNEIDDIATAFELMADEHSEDVFSAVFKAHATSCYDLEMLSPDLTLYFDVNVPFRYNYRSFVDCGAFTGDTFEDLIKSHKVEQYFGFEPTEQNYGKLVQTVNMLRDNLQKCILLPLGVGEKNEAVRFTSAEGGSAKIKDTGDNIIQIVRLDDMLKGYENLFIKMDIEGAETQALKGAKNIISNTAPDLAISVYHKISDLWRIALLLKEMVPEYRFYMRSHSTYSIETVLYATVGK